MPDFLLEIGCEEIPARMIDAASLELRERVDALLKRERLWDPTSENNYFDTPRRLGFLVKRICPAQPDVTEQITGPSVTVAYKNGEPTPAAHAFARKAGVDVAQLGRISTHKGEYVAAKVTRKGCSAAEVLAENLPKEIASIYWPKNMYWRQPNERFVRPVRWLVAMLDEQVIPLEVFGIATGRTSRGHRILSDGEVAIPRADIAYGALRSAKVLHNTARKLQIREGLDKAVTTIPGARWREDPALLDTVVNLTEFPSVILGGFDQQFLALPEEVLVTVMRDHQKYFAIEGANGKLLPHFLAVLNTDSDPQGLIRHGNERVLRARFNDARFFWETDQKKSLLERMDLLKHVTFQKDLGSYYEKTLRVQRLCSWLSEILKQHGMAVRPGVVHKAACLAKTDLTTELVKEFTELQGIVGGLYARVQKLDAGLPEATRMAVADVIYDHYKPESTDDEVPRSTEGAVLSIGDKADTIAGMFSLGLVPSGSKDPFALRRQANAIVKVIAEKRLPLRLTEMMRDARAGYQKSEAEKKFVNDAAFAESVSAFFRERLEFYLKDVRGYAYDVVKAVLGAGSDDVVDALARAEGLALTRKKRGADFEAVCISFKRIKNILRQAEEKKIAIPEQPDESLMGSLDGAEVTLWRNGVATFWPQYEVAREKGKYESALPYAASLRPMLDRFFDEVLVMVDDDRLRANRLAMLKKLYTSFSTIADFSEIVTEGKT
jgi:glycyl-tRNA synthetase beta chain